MPALVILVGVGCGALLAAIGLVLWGHSRRPLEIARAVVAVRWLAGALLLAGAVLAWMGEPAPAGPVPQLILMAALATLPDIRPRPLDRRGTLLILPALVLAGTGLTYIASSAAATGQVSLTPIALSTTICGGLGARALGQALYWAAAPIRELSTENGTEPGEETPPPSPSGGGEGPGVQDEGAPAVTYALLTLLVGGVAIVHLWTRGTVSGGTTGEGGLAGVWLAWSAAWLGPRRPSRLRAILIVVAASSLILLAALPSQ
jgi:hypothetical protein